MGANPWENHLLIGHYTILSFLVLYNLIILCEQKPAAEPARPLHWVQPLCALAIWGENFEPDPIFTDAFSNMFALNHGDFPHATASVLSGRLASVSAPGEADPRHGHWWCDGDDMGWRMRVQTKHTLWWTNILPWKITIFNGKTHYKRPFSIAMLNYRMVPQKTSRFPSSPWKFPSKFSQELTPIRSIAGIAWN